MKNKKFIIVVIIAIIIIILAVSLIVILKKSKTMPVTSQNNITKDNLPEYIKKAPVGQNEIPYIFNFTVSGFVDRWNNTIDKRNQSSSWNKYSKLEESDFKYQNDTSDNYKVYLYETKSLVSGNSTGQGIILCTTKDGYVAQIDYVTTDKINEEGLAKDIYMTIIEDATEEKAKTFIRNNTQTIGKMTNHSDISLSTVTTRENNFLYLSFYALGK